MRGLPLASLQPDWGILALWVTGRAMELARELFALWGYVRVDELVWLKTNQLQRLIRTGRTGHWLNHTCEHLLVALKRPANWPRDKPVPWDEDPGLRALRRGIDTDVVVAEVRETSRKPDEVYGVLERLSSGRKLELFGRKHNIREGWLTLGNQREYRGSSGDGVELTASRRLAGCRARPARPPREAIPEPDLQARSVVVHEYASVISSDVVVQMILVLPVGRQARDRRQPETQSMRCVYSALISTLASGRSIPSTPSELSATRSLRWYFGIVRWPAGASPLGL